VVHEHLDGSINIFYQGKKLKSESGSKWTQTDIKEEDQILQARRRTKGNGVCNHELLTFLVCVDTHNKIP